MNSWWLIAALRTSFAPRLPFLLTGRVNPGRRIVLALGGIIWIALACGQAPSNSDSAVDLSSPADFSGRLLTLDGEETDLQQIEGKVVFLNFWATWCKPCLVEMPSMEDLYNKFSGQGLAMVAVTEEDPAIVRSYLERNAYSFSILLDPQGELAYRFDVRGLPTTVVFDSQREVIFRHVGAYSWNTPEMLERFRQLLAD